MSRPQSVPPGTAAGSPSAEVVDVQEVDPRADPRWWELASGPEGSLFTSPPWIEAVSGTYGFAPRARLGLDGSGRAVAGLAWTDVSDMRGFRRLALPFSDRADPLVTDTAAWEAIVEGVLSGPVPFTLRCLDNSPAAEDPRWTTLGESAWHQTRLDRPLDELEAALRPQARRNIATARRAGVEVVLRSDVEAVEEYHQLHVQLRKDKYRLLAQPVALFHRIWQGFAERDGVRTALALVHGRPVAGAVYLVWRDTLYYKFGASLRDSLSMRPNDAIHWAVIRWAHGRGIRALDWGLSDLDQPGLCEYKRKWASVEGRIRTLNTGGAPLGHRTDVDETLPIVTELLTDPAVPLHVTGSAGSALYRYFC